MFCTKCGAKIYDDNAEFCSVCGAALKDNSISYESETQKINRLINKINKEKSVNHSFNSFMSDRKNDDFESDYNINQNKQEEEEWLNPEAISEIWNIPQGANENQNTDEDLLPDGTPAWLDEIKQEEEYQEYKSKFHLMEHPLIFTSIVAFLMLITSIILIVVIWNS